MVRIIIEFCQQKNGIGHFFAGQSIEKLPEHTRAKDENASGTWTLQSPFGQ